ncbi:short chain dehydrogenase domain-containing protein [Rhizoctonia solani AG-1 IA]|uniref:Short chain dehydrogenase domain-containing protein n=1 Tax=Thanatephorus cucumeris (strain AG1-IA) TaxID=983506 RepID=L8WXJ2_THACA|nr:short chain dehydrogenase domain-containing protein [Rhizoctonia solani AG-1 IA]
MLTVWRNQVATYSVPYLIAPVALEQPGNSTVVQEGDVNSSTDLCSCRCRERLRHWCGCRVSVPAGKIHRNTYNLSISRAFAKKGYSVALIARNPEHLKSIADEMRANGSDATGFPVTSYTYENIHGVFDEIKKYWPNREIRVAVWNVAHNVRRPFLEITEQIVQDSVRESIQLFNNSGTHGTISQYRDQYCRPESEVRLNKHGKRGALIFTSATAAWRGNTTTSAFSAGKHGERALAQSLNKEFGPQNIHVSNVIIDGPILNGRLEKLTTDKSLLANEDLRLDPTSIAAVSTATVYTFCHKTGLHGLLNLTFVPHMRSGKISRIVPQGDRALHWLLMYD